jgi:hypothetical protein
MKQLQDHIRLYENAFPEDLRDKLMQLKDSPVWTPAHIGSGFDATVRDTFTIFLSTQESRAQTPWIHEGIGSAVQAAFARYQEEFPDVRVQGDSGYEMLHYPPGGFYSTHIDEDMTHPRVISCSIALNDAYTGGDFSFFGGEMTLRMPALSILLFPSNFQYPHAIEPVETGDRYSIVTWLI